MKEYFLTVDVGTTAVKVGAVNRRFEVEICLKREYRLKTEGERVTFPPRLYWEYAREGLCEIVRKIGDDSVAGIAITTQGETMIPVDEAGEPLGEAVVWLDGRAGKQGEKISALVSRETFYSRTGVAECNGFCPVSKLLWFKEEEPELYRKARYFLLLEDYLLMRLTGEIVTEKSLLSTTGYFDIMQDRLWEELLTELGLDPEKIPRALDCGQVVGTLTEEAARQLGLPKTVPAVTGAMDQVCGALGAGNFVPGALTETTGTALCIGKTVQKEKIRTDSYIPVYRHYSDELQLLLPVCMTGGMALKWFKDTFCAEEEACARENGQDIYEVLSRMAQKAGPLSGGVVMLPYLSGSLQPHYAPEYRGGFLGVGMHSRKEDFVRALMEGVGYMLRENLCLLDQRGERQETIFSMGGGAKSPVWCQIKADITGRKICPLKEEETALAGAAMLCARGVEGRTSSWLKGEDREVKRIYTPDPGLVERYDQGFQRYCRLLEATINEFFTLS